MLLVEAGLAAWRLAFMLVEEDGPDQVFARLRDKTGIEYDETGRVIAFPPLNPLHCVVCTAVYTSILMLYAPRRIRQAYAIAGVATLIQLTINAYEYEASK